MTPTADQLFERARNDALKDPRDMHSCEYARCTVDEIRTLLDAGAKPCSINNPFSPGDYLHIVEYRGQLFLTRTPNFFEGFKRYEKSDGIY
jgi:hypothetical protein